MKTSQIEKILNEQYGVGIAVAPMTATLWAAERCDDPKQQLKIANRIKARHGKPLAYAPYGHPAF